MPSYARARRGRVRSAALLAAVAASVAAALAPSCSDEPAERPRPARPNVLLISLDSLRPDRLGCYGHRTRTGVPISPNVDKVAAEGVLFENAVSSTTWTLPAHHALMSSVPDLAHGVWSDGFGPTLSRVQLGEALSAAGYATAGFFSGPYLGSKYGFGGGFDVWENASGVEEQLIEQGAAQAAAGANGSAGAAPPAPAHGGLQQAATEISGKVEQSYHVTSSAKRVSDAGLAWLSKQQALDATQPFFLFLHYFDIHYDFAPPDESFARGFWPDGKRPRLNGDHFFDHPEIKPGMAPDDLAGVVSYYDGEIRWTDSQVGKVLDQLDRMGLARDTLVVIVSDHGDEFFDHGAKGHRQNLFQSTLSMALVMRWPGMLPAGTRVASRASIVDVAPTLLDCCGALDKADFQLPEIAGLAPGDRVHGMWGSSLRPLIDGRESGDREAYAFLANRFQERDRPSYHFGLLTGRFKVVVTQRYRVVHVDDDPSKPIVNEEPGEVSALVFDLAADPGETKDLSRSRDPAVLAAIERWSEAYSRAGRLGRWCTNVECGPPPPPLSEVERTMLGQLGYTADADAPRLPPGTKLFQVAPPPPPFPRAR